MTLHPSPPGSQSPPDIIVDVRCLQDPNYAPRGIGRHATALLEFARACPTIAAGATLTALQDPTLPPLSPRHRALFDAVRTTAYTGARDRPVWFVQLSPMTHDPLFVARLLHHAAPLSAAVIYDFIPLDDPTRYLTDAKSRLDYQTMLAWLAKYDLFAPISQSSAARLSELIPATPESITVTGAPLDPIFEPTSTSQRRSSSAHILVIGGGDPRKNVACAVSGHARSAAMQKAAIPLVITGHYTPQEVADLRARAAADAGDPSLVRIPGHVDEAALVALYRDAIAVVVPSLAEGFSLPVIEAMAAGVPAIASRIPPHSELIASENALFPPHDPGALADILTRLQTGKDLTDTLVAQQRDVWPKFRAAEVAQRFWTSLERRAAARATVPPSIIVGGRRPSIALVTPLPPDRSGVADFSAAGIAAFAARAELHIFTPTKTPAPQPGATGIHALDALPYLSSRFDRVISILGNSEFHLAIHRLLLRHGGACIAHDSRMLAFYAVLLGTDRARAVGAGELGRPVSAADINLWLDDEQQLPATFLGEIVAAAEPLFLHAKRSVDAVRQRFNVAATHLPFPTYRNWPDGALTPAARDAARARLGFTAGEIIIASFGFLQPTKSPEDCIQTLALLRARPIPARLHFVGSFHMDIEPLRQRAHQLGVADHVVFNNDFLDEADYRDHLLAADLGLQLRRISNGAISGALQDCVTAGLATVANEDLADAIDAPPYIHRIINKPPPARIADALAQLIADGAHRGRHDAARAAYVADHSFTGYVDRIWTALAL
jgi:glycosyltransferase involved in cell wall biosynthesis